MWEDTYTFKIINNKNIFAVMTVSLILLKMLSINKFKISSKELINFTNIAFLFFIFLMPVFSITIIENREFFINLIDDNKFEIYLDTFNFDNLYFYYFVPLFWILITIFTNNYFIFTIIASILFYTFLSLFLHNHITLPAIYIIEIFFSLWLTMIFLKDKTSLNNKISILIIIFLINFTNFFYTKEKSINNIEINLKQLSNFQELNYICPGNLKLMSDINNVVKSDLLSGLLNKRFYSDFAYDKNYNFAKNYLMAVPMAIPPKEKFKNPCKK